jgi:hypothetical protein
MLAVFKTKPFSRFARKAHIADAVLWQAATLANQGQVDADLGSGVLKLRIARPGEGKSGGFRTILFFRQFERAVFVFGFEKKDQANISAGELEAFKELARVVLAYSQQELAKRVADGALIEIHMPRST